MERITVEYNSLTRIFKSDVIENSISHMRDENTKAPEFRTNLDIASNSVGFLLASELLSPLESRSIRTPCAETQVRICEPKNTLVPVILRSAYPLCKAIQSYFPKSDLALIDIKRNEKTAEPVMNYDGLPNDLSIYDITLLADPMLATGGSMSMAIEMLKKRGAKNIFGISLIAAPEGIQYINEKHPDVIIYTCSVDLKLNEKMYIIPGLGDCGDRCFEGINATFFDKLNQVTLQYRPDGTFQKFPGRKL